MVLTALAGHEFGAILILRLSEPCTSLRGCDGRGGRDLQGECSSSAGECGDRGLAGAVTLGLFYGPLSGLLSAFGLVGGVVEVAGEGGGSLRSILVSRARR